MIKSRPWNFSAGPSVLPEAVLEQAAAEMLDWHGSGMSVMEMSHRGSEFTQICDEAEADLRELLGVGDEFAVLFMQGGATAENAIVPMNLIGRSEHKHADYVLTGSWSTKSFKEAKKYGDPAVAATNEAALDDDGQTYGPLTWVPAVDQWQVRPSAAYLHLCSNETIGGVEFMDWPDANQMARSAHLTCRWWLTHPHIFFRVRWISPMLGCCMPEPRKTPVLLA